MARRRSRLWRPGAACVVLLTVATAAWADFALDRDELTEIGPRPGTRIDVESLPRHAHLVDRDLARFVAAGHLALNVGESLSFEPHPAFVFASRQQRMQARLGETPGVLPDFAQGLPFPAALAPDDADAGRKLAWNMRYAYLGDSGRLPELHWQLRDWRSDEVRFEMQFAARSLRFTHRHVLPPVPALPDNPQDAYAAFYLDAIDAGSYDGTQALIFANRDEARPVHGWVYLPQLGRTQALASFAAEETMFGSDIAATDFLVHSGRLTDMEWRWRGQTFLLLPFYRHDAIEPSARKARQADYWHVAFEGRAGCFPRVHWQLRPVHVLEGRAVDPKAPIQRRLFYLDQQTHVAALWKLYDGNDRLRRVNIAAYAHPRSHVPGNHDVGAPILTAFSAIDIATNRCTTVQVLAEVNIEDVTPADFDTARMQSGGGRGFGRR